LHLISVIIIHKNGKAFSGIADFDVLGGEGKGEKETRRKGDKESESRDYSFHGVKELGLMQ